jgi:hypothetical protein
MQDDLSKLIEELRSIQHRLDRLPFHDVVTYKRVAGARHQVATVVQTLNKELRAKS